LLQAVSGLRSCLSAIFFLLSPVRMFSSTCLIRCIRPYPPHVIYVAKKRPFEQCAVAVTLGARHEALMSMGGYRLGKGLVENMYRGTFRRGCWVRNYLTEYTPCRVLPAVVDPGDLRRHVVSLLRLRPCSGMRTVSPRSLGRML
jgi:hypothetical protein